MLLIISPTHAYATQRLAEELRAIEQDFELFDLHDLARRNFKIDITKYTGMFVRQGFPHFKAVMVLAKKFTEAGKLLIDANIIDGVGEGKWQALQKLIKAGVAVPETKILTSLQEINTSDQATKVIKWIYGFAGQHTYLVKNKDECAGLSTKYPNGELMLQEYIAADFEYKVITVGYRSIPVVLKFPYDTIRARPDFSKPQRVSKAEAVNVVSLAENASQVLGRELAKTDILEKGGKLVVLEVNRWPGFESFEKATGYNVGGDFAEYLKEKIRGT